MEILAISYNNGMVENIGPFETPEKRLEFIDRLSKRKSDEIYSIRTYSIISPENKIKELGVIEHKVTIDGKTSILRELKAPFCALYDITAVRNRIFLAGSIEQGKAKNWQELFVDKIKNTISTYPVNNMDSTIIFNPRRDNWDPTLTEDSEEFAEQVAWETDHLTDSNIRAFYFEPGTASRVSMLELGRFGVGLVPGEDSDKVMTFVCCPEGYQGRGNVKRFCSDKCIPFYDSFDAFVSAIGYYIYKKPLKLK